MTAYAPPVKANSRQVMATAPMAGPAQCRVPPRMLISTTVSGTVRLNVSAVVTYETKSAWIPPTQPASAHDTASAASFQR